MEMFDQPQSYNTLGLGRIGYRVLFKDVSNYRYKDWVTFTGINTPPFTNASDMQENPYWAGKDDDRTNDDAAQYDNN